MTLFYLISVALMVFAFVLLIQFEKSDEYANRFINSEVENPCEEIIKIDNKQRKIDSIVNMYKKK